MNTPKFTILPLPTWDRTALRTCEHVPTRSLQPTSHPVSSKASAAASTGLNGDTILSTALACGLRACAVPVENNHLPDPFEEDVRVFCRREEEGPSIFVLQKDTCI